LDCQAGVFSKEPTVAVRGEGKVVSGATASGSTVEGAANWAPR